MRIPTPALRDVDVPQELALNTAYQTTVQKQLARTKEKRPAEELGTAIQQVQGELEQDCKGK